MDDEYRLFCVVDDVALTVMACRGSASLIGVGVMGITAPARLALVLRPVGCQSR